MVRHVHSAICIGGDEPDVAQGPAPNCVIPFFVGEQQTVCGLVHHRRKLGVSAPHEDERNRPGPPAQVDGNNNDCDRLRVQQHNRESVSHIGDFSQLGSKLGGWSPIGANESGRITRTEKFCCRRHSAKADGR